MDASNSPSVSIPTVQVGEAENCAGTAPLFQLLKSTVDERCFGLIVGLNSASCYPALFDKSNWSKLPLRQTIPFELETYVPLDAESIDYGILTHRDGWLVVSTDRTIYAEDIATKRSEGNWLCAVCPLVFLAIEPLLDELCKHTPAVIVICNGSATDFLAIEDGTVVDWLWFGTDPDAAQNHVENWLNEHPNAQVIGFCLRESMRNLICNFVAPAQLDFVETPLAAAVQATVDEVLCGRRTLRLSLASVEQTSSDMLAPYAKSLSHLGWLTLLLLLTLGGASQWQAMQSREALRDIEQQQITMYQQLFPNEPVPVGIRSRLESEFRQLDATRGPGAHAPELQSILTALHAFLSSMPSEETRFRWEFLHFTAGKIARANGVASTFEEYELVAGNLRTSGFAVPPVSSSQVEGGVSMRLENVARVQKPNTESVNSPHAEVAP